MTRNPRLNQFACLPRDGFLTIAALCMALSVGCSSSSAPVTDDPQAASVPSSDTQSEAGAAKTGTVTLEIKVDGKTQSVTVEDVAVGSTLESVMRSIKSVPVKMRGSGTTAFVEAIGDVATSGTDGWVYRVDGEFSSEGVGSMQLDPPTTVTWTYGEASELLPQ